MAKFRMQMTVLLFCVPLLLVSTNAWAEEDEPPANVALVGVRLPITGNADQTIQTSLARTRDALIAKARENQDARRPILVLHFIPPQDENDARSQFERVLALARFLSSGEMAGVRTVAYMPQSILGHGTLLAIACEEIVMAPDALLGSARNGDEGAEAIQETIVAAYREIAESRRSIPVALAIGMMNASDEVLQIETEAGSEFILGSNREEFIQNRDVISETTLVAQGALAQFDGREGRQFGFVKYLASDLNGLARALDIDAADLQEEALITEEWKPVIIDISGPITSRLASRIETMVGRELELNSNWIGFRIDSPGGDLNACLRIANFIAGLDKDAVRTVAYVPTEASGGAALVALSCQQLVMHPTAKLNTRISAPEENIEEIEAALQAASTSVKESLAVQTGKNWSLLAATIDSKVKLFQYRNKLTGQRQIMSEVEAFEREDSKDWQRGEPLQELNTSLSLTGEQAESLELSWQNVEGFDELVELYRLPKEPREVEPNWALELVESLAAPELAAVLIAIGIFGIYFELRAPGIGVGAFIASLSFMLFFWSMYLNGTAGWLEILLLLGGISFILLEIFVLPGFGIFGLGGGAMVIASIILASLTFVWPQTEAEIEEMTRSVGTVAIAGLGVMALVLTTRRYLPQAPLFRNVVLEPPAAEERTVISQREAMVDYSYLVGRQGTATTDLRPTGKAEIDHELLDVIAESEPLDRGTPVVVVDAHANRVVVRAAGPA